MEFRRLEYVLAIADERSFTAAAARAHVAQPAVSAQVAALERELGQRLFTRTPKGAVPTAAGAELIGHARAVFARLDEARAAMDELAGLVRGQVRVGMIRGAQLGRLAGVLGSFRRRHPGVDLTVREGESLELVAELREGTLDLALVGLAGADPDGVSTRVALTDSLAALVAPGHAWSARASVPLADLAGQPIATLATGTGVRAAFDAACAARDLRPAVAFEVGTVGAALELAREGLGIAVVPGDSAAVLAPDLHAVRLRPTVRSRLALAWASATPRDGRPAARALVAETLAAYRRAS